MVNRFLILLCLCFSATIAQYGNANQRENRRFSPFGGKNFLPHLTERVTAIIHLQPFDRPSMFVHPFHSKPIIEPNQQYDKYSKPIMYPAMTYENYYPPEPPSWQENQGRNPAPSAYEYSNDRSDVKFPGESSYPAPFPNEQVDSESEDVKFPDSGPAPPMLTTTPEPATLSPLSPEVSEAGPAFTSVPTNTLPTLTPALVPASEEGPAFSRIPGSGTTLPPLTPVPTSESRGSFNFKPTSTFNAPCEIDGLRGSCIALLACEDFTKLLRDVQSNPQVIPLLRRAHCGFEGNDPKVCCPVRGIPTEGSTPTAAPPTPAPTAAPAPIPEQKAADTDASEYVDALPQPPVCGSSNATFTRVVGGIDAKLGDFPWMALLGYQKRGSTSWSCGGSLVSSKHILTAAHCIYGHEKSLYVVRLGELDLAKEDDGAAPVDILIKRMLMHEHYDRTSVSNDIGILYLENEVQFTDLIKPICVPSSSELRANTFENYNPIVAGWGSIKYDGPSASILQVVQLPVVSNTNCKEIFKPYKQISIDERVMCAGFKKGGKDACQGDSGGPLMQPIWNREDYTTHFYQIGVVSFGKKCAEPGFPGVYTRVTTFVPWIEEKLLGPNAART